MAEGRLYGGWMSSAATSPPPLRHVGIVFSGGPAPGANAVIAAVASTFRRSGVEVIAFMHGYGALEKFDAAEHPLVEGTDYKVVADRDLPGLRNRRGVSIGTGRANPGRNIKKPADLDDPEKTAPLRNVLAAFAELGVDALVSIGGDDTLKTANFLFETQKRLPADAPRVRIVHVPKTIDNDYRGIDFTFGFFTAVDVMAKELLNLRADAMATKSYFIAETMGRRAGWLAYGVAMAGEAHLVVGVEDVVGDLALPGTGTTDQSGTEDNDARLDLDRLADRVVELILAREARGKHYGTVVISEGLAELLPAEDLDEVGRDAHGHVSLGKMELGKRVAKMASERYEKRTGKAKKVTAVQLGYEARCAAPHAFDVMLGTQLGFGAYRALYEEHLDGHMVSVAGQLELRFVSFGELVDKDKLTVDVRFIQRTSDFYRLARELETRVAKKPL